MALFRRLFPVVVGIAAGVAATLIAQQYDRDRTAAEEEYIESHDHIEGPEEADTSAEAPKSVPAPQPFVPVARAVQQPDCPNVNPVADITEKPPVVDGKIDVTQIASAEDFADWDDLGCRG